MVLHCKLTRILQNNILIVLINKNSDFNDVRLLDRISEKIKGEDVYSNYTIIFANYDETNKFSFKGKENICKQLVSLNYKLEQFLNEAVIITVLL